MLFFVELGAYATGPENAAYFALGNALQLTANAGIFGVIATVANERHFGTLPILLGSPANRLVTFMSRAVVNVLDGIVTVIIGFAIAIGLFGQVAGLLGGELLVGLAWALAGYALFATLEGWARRGGMQEAY